MSSQDKTEKRAVPTIAKKTETQFFHRFRQSASQFGHSRYWRLLAQRGWRPAKDEAINILANVKSKHEKHLAAQALFILTGDQRLLDGACASHRELLMSPAEASLEASSPAGSRTEATIIFMRHHQAAFAPFTEAYLNEGPFGQGSETSWEMLSQQLIPPGQAVQYPAIQQLQEMAQAKKEFSFYVCEHFDSIVYYHPEECRFHIAKNLLCSERDRELFHKMLFQWLIFQNEFWYCNFLSPRQMAEFIRQSANNKLTLSLLPDWFPRCKEERQSFPNSTQFEFLQSHRNPFLLTLSDLRSFKKHWQQSILDSQVKLTQDIIGLAQAVLGTDLRTAESALEQVPVPIPLRKLLNTAARLHFTQVERFDRVC